MTIQDLPALNATLNATAFALLVLAWWFIKQGKVEAHKQTMLAAFAASALFLTSYVIYHANAGSKPYPGTGVWRTVYFTILIPHVILAAAVLPMALVTLSRGLKMDRARHKAIARITLPLWAFVSVSGVVVYLMLYW